jgi:hypothetical protein
VNSNKQIHLRKESNTAGETARIPRTVVRNLEFKKPDKEENKEVIKGCQDCAKEKNMRARLECSHACYNICLMKYASKCFLECRSYDYCVPCELCNKTQKLSKCLY